MVSQLPVSSLRDDTELEIDESVAAAIKPHEPHAADVALAQETASKDTMASASELESESKDEDVPEWLTEFESKDDGIPDWAREDIEKAKRNPQTWLGHVAMRGSPSAAWWALQRGLSKKKA